MNPLAHFEGVRFEPGFVEHRHKNLPSGAKCSPSIIENPASGGDHSIAMPEPWAEETRSDSGRAYSGPAAAFQVPLKNPEVWFRRIVSAEIPVRREPHIQESNWNPLCIAVPQGHKGPTVRQVKSRPRKAG